MSSQPSQTNTVATSSQSEKRLKIHPRTTAPARVAQVIAQRSLGKTKQKIAQELGMSRNTVDAILNQSASEHNWSTREQQIVPKAFDAIEKAIDKGNENIAVRFIENVVWSRSQETRPIDNRIQLAISTLITTDGTSTSRTEAGAKAPPVSKRDPLQTQFSEFSSANVNKTLDLAPTSVQLMLPFPEEVP